MSANKKRINYINSYNKDHYLRYTLSIPKDNIEIVKKIEEMKKERKMNSYIADLIKKDLEDSKNKSY